MTKDLVLAVATRATWSVAVAVWALALGAAGGDTNAPATLSAEEIVYRQAIVERSKRIIDALELDDVATRQRVVQIVADQYRKLRDIHAARDAALANGAELEDGETQARLASAEAQQAVIAAHREFVARLGAEIDPRQVDQIKDGMTYGVVPITYKAYLDLLPDLHAEEKRYIQACLLEAREYAMDAGSSEEKHAWFGKYKGRINNYLSAKGYDLKQAEREMAERRQADDRQ